MCHHLLTLNFYTGGLTNHIPILRYPVTNNISNDKAFVQTLSEPSQDGPTHQVELTKFVEAEPEVETDTQTQPDVDYKIISNPYPKQVLAPLMRKYRVATFNWGTAPLNAVLDFPNTLINIPYITSLVAPFRWMRAGLEIEVRINSTAFHYGCLLLSYLPNTNSNTFHTSGIIQQSGNHGVLLSASLQQSATIRIPYVNPDSFFAIPTCTTEICKFFITSVTPLLRTGADISDTVEVQVFASFMDVDLAGPIFLAVPGAAPANFNLPRVEHQSGNVNQVKVSKEAVNKSSRGVEAGVASAMTTVSKVVDSIPIVGGILADLMPLIGSIFDKPTDVSTRQSIAINMSRDWASGQGLDYSNSLSMKKGASLSTDVKLMGNVNPEVKLNEVFGVPQIRAVKTFDNASLTDKTFYWPLRAIDLDTPGSCDYAQFIARFFQYNKISYKFLLNFYTSPFISGRFKISVLYQTPDTTYSLNSGDIVSTILDVKGDTIYKFTVPYLYPTMYRAIDDDVVDIPVLAIELLSPIVGQGASGFNPSIVMVMSRSFGEDTQFAQMIEYYVTPTAKEKQIRDAQPRVVVMAPSAVQQIPSVKHQSGFTKKVVINPEILNKLEDFNKEGSLDFYIMNDCDCEQCQLDRNGPGILAEDWHKFMLEQGYTPTVYEGATSYYREPTVKPNVEHQMDLQAEFKNVFEPIIFGTSFSIEHGVTTCEQVTTINEMCKRYVGFDQSPTNPNKTYPTYVKSGAFHKLSEIFFYWRGGRRLKIVTQKAGGTPTNNDFIAFAPTNSSLIPYAAGNGLYYTCPALWPVLELEIPWYATRPFQPTHPNVPVNRVVDHPADITGVASYLVSLNTVPIGLISGGEDFQYGWLMPPIT